ncbi:HlyD family efflux transporter periplasmic adaptor subunit [Myxosarcina sp. GI1(2024)]
MDTTVVNIKREEQLFAQAEQNWNLPVIYEQIAAAKHKLFGEKQLTPLQKTILRGLLCNYSPKQIATCLPSEMHQSLVNITWNLHKCVQELVGIESKTVESYRDIPYWLETAGFKTQVKSDSSSESQLTIIQNTTCKYLPEPKEEVETRSFQRPKQAKVIPQQIPSSQQNISLYIPSNSEDSAIEPKPNSSSLSLIDNRHQIVPAEESLAVVDENDFMPPMSRWTKLGGLFLAGSVAISIALSAFTPYDVSVKAQSTVRPAEGLKLVEATSEGKITEIRVEENQLVRKGDVIAVLDRSRLETRADQLKIAIQQANLQLKQIEAQINAQESRLSAEIEQTNRAIAAAKSQLALRRREHQDRQISSNARVSEAQANLGLAQEELSQAQTELTSAEAELQSARAALNSAQARKERYQSIAASGAISQNLLDEVSLEVEQRQHDVTVRQAAIARQKQEIARRQQAIAAAEARLNNARVGVNPSSAEVEIATENIARERATGRATIASLKREREALIQQRIEIQKQLERERKELAQVKQEARQTTIVASADGILFELKINNPGQTVFSGEEIARIAPSDTSLSLEALIPAQKIGKVKLGQLTQTKISACPYPDYGTLKGVVTKVAPDTTSPLDNNSPSPGAAPAFYKVTIEPESMSLGPKNNQCSLQLGMEGQTDITTKAETVLKFMLRKARLVTDF